MSAEGKKKRGISGVANAASKPFRLNGRAPDWRARELGCFHVPPAAAMGHPMHGDDGRYDRMIAHAQKRVTHPILRLDDEQTHKIAAE